MQRDGVPVPTSRFPCVFTLSQRNLSHLGHWFQHSSPIVGASEPWWGKATLRFNFGKDNSWSPEEKTVVWRSVSLYFWFVFQPSSWRRISIEWDKHLFTMIFINETSMPLISFPRPGNRIAEPGNYLTTANAGRHHVKSRAGAEQAAITTGYW